MRWMLAATLASSHARTSRRNRCCSSVYVTSKSMASPLTSSAGGHGEGNISSGHGRDPLPPRGPDLRRLALDATGNPDFWSNLDSVVDEEGDDHYSIFLWPAPSQGVRVLKQWSGR